MSFNSYGIGLYNGHYPSHPHWPFVSDVGALPPESCFFSFFMALYGLTGFISSIFYHEYIHDTGHGSNLNTAGRRLAVSGYIGVLIIATFQVKVYGGRDLIFQNYIYMAQGQNVGNQPYTVVALTTFRIKMRR